MSFNLISLATNRWGPIYLQAVCNLLGRRQSYQLCDVISAYLARQREHPFIAALHENMSVVRGLPLDSPELTEDVSRQLCNALHGYTDLYLLLSKRREKVLDRIELDQFSKETLYAALTALEGTVLVGMHNTAFDLLLLGLPEIFPAVQILGNPEPRGSSRTMNVIRWRRGVEITPATPAALLEAAHNLRAGNTVVLGADLPQQGGDCRDFFGRPSRLSGGYGELACMTGARVLFGSIHSISPGRYRAELRPINPPAGSNRRDKAKAITEAVIRRMEACIRSRPYEWLMPYPIWNRSIPAI
jgi:lauroyl/myristoyl acyltransferase